MTPSESDHPTATRDRLALDRTKLANERTALAYLRTSLMLAATGVTLLKLYPSSFWAIPISWVFICLAVVVLAAGFRRFRRLAAALQEQFLNG